MMKTLVSGLIAVSLCACSADPGYEPRYEPQERPVEAQPEPAQVTTKSIEASPKDVAAMQLCADKFALRLPKTSQHYAVQYDLTVKSDGITAKVKDSQFPGTELESCLTKVLERLEIPDAATSTSKVSPQSRSAVGVVQVAAAPIALLPIVLVAGGITILLAASIYVAIEIVDVATKRRRPDMSRCLDAAAGGGELWKAFCRSIQDRQVKESCWGLAELNSEEEKRNWCNEYTGFW